MVTIRPGTPQDGVGIGDVHAESWRVGYQGLFPPDDLAAAVERRRRMWTGGSAVFGLNGGTLLIAESEQITGFIHFGPSSAREKIGEVYGFYVHPSAWGKGTAQALMAEALISLASSFTRAILWTNARAGRARRFYSKSGWTQTGVERTERLWDGLDYPAVEYDHSLDQA